MPDRAVEIDRFLGRTGWLTAHRSNLAGDASARRYLRLTNAGRTAVLMDAPPSALQIAPFLLIARHLSALGYSAPAILAEDLKNGLILMEDFGDSTFNRVLQAGPDREAELYRLAVDVLIALHRSPADRVLTDAMPDYQTDMLLEEVSRFLRWYVPAMRGESLPVAAERDFMTHWADALAPLQKLPKTLVLRDFHIDNLVLLDNRQGAQRCGLLDFQDAVAGPGAYDLVSLLEDARRDIDVGLVTGLHQYYCDSLAITGTERTAFAQTCAVLAAQRHTKIIGLFTRLRVRDGKPAYLQHIPRVWKLLERNLCHPALSDLKNWLDAYLPDHNRGIPDHVADAAK